MYRRIYLSCCSADLKSRWVKGFIDALNDRGISVCNSGIISSNEGVEADPSGLLERADAMIAVLSPSSSSDPGMRRDIEYAVDADLPVFVIRTGNVQPRGALKYYLSPFQWMEVSEDDPISAASDVADGMEVGESGASTLERNGPRFRMLPLTAAAAAFVIAALTLLLCRGGADFLVIGHDPSTVEFLRSLDYDVDTEDSLPSSDDMGIFDAVVISAPPQESWERPLYEYVSGGGSLVLSGGGPYFLGMPDWMGMELYSNYWGEDFDIVLCLHDTLEGFDPEVDAPLYHQSSYMDGGAVLEGSVTASVDACFAGNDSLAAAVRNTVGRGRVCWISITLSPRASGDGSGYTTEEYDRYIAAVYRWLDRDGPGR